MISEIGKQINGKTEIEEKSDGNSKMQPPSPPCMYCIKNVLKKMRSIVDLWGLVQLITLRNHARATVCRIIKSIATCFSRYFFCWVENLTSEINPFVYFYLVIYDGRLLVARWSNACYIAYSFGS